MQSILIDWQGGFVGSVANDLMWSIFPFLEANQDKKVKFIYSEKAKKTSQKSLNCIWYFKKRWERFVQNSVAFQNTIYLNFKYIPLLKL